MQEHKQLHVSREKVDSEQVNYSESFNLAANSCVATDLQFLIRKVNITGLNLFGQTFAFLDRMPLLQFVSMSNRHAVCALAKALLKNAADRSKSIEITVCPPRLAAVTCSAVVTLIRDSTGEPRGFLWVLRTGQPLHSQEMDALRQRAHQAVHEFSNLLAGIRIHADVAAVTRSSRDRQESLEAIRNGCERAAGLLSQLRALKNDAIE
jgi:signal transduction histidine kinase